MSEFQLVLVNPDPALCSDWQAHFSGLPNVEIAMAYFEELPQFDCMVSAANSFGLMDGGVDAAVARFFGSGLMQRVQRRILNEYLGEQPVGTSLIVETGHLKHPYVAHSPTMRVPMVIAKTDSVYRAMWATLLAIRQHNLRGNRPIKIVACPGLGTATGGMPFSEAARQMSLAYRNFLAPPSYIDWPMAHERQIQIRW